MHSRTLSLHAETDILCLHSSLAEGVENAAIVCCFISLDYEKSENCQVELQYAHKRGRRVVLFMLYSKTMLAPFHLVAIEDETL